MTQSIHNNVKYRATDSSRIYAAVPSRAKEGKKIIQINNQTIWTWAALLSASVCQFHSSSSSWEEVCLPTHENKQNFAHRSSAMPNFLKWRCGPVVLMVALRQPSWTWCFQPAGIIIHHCLFSKTGKLMNHTSHVLFIWHQTAYSVRSSTVKSCLWKTADVLQNQSPTFRQRILNNNVQPLWKHWRVLCVTTLPSA